MRHAMATGCTNLAPQRKEKQTGCGEKDDRREGSRRKQLNGAGKVVLAAIVHHDAVWHTSDGANTTTATNNTETTDQSQLATNARARDRKAAHNEERAMDGAARGKGTGVSQPARNTHEEEQESASKRKFSKLFSRKQQGNKKSGKRKESGPEREQQDEKRVEESTLIDYAQSNELASGYNNSKQVESAPAPLDKQQITGNEEMDLEAAANYCDYYTDQSHSHVTTSSEQVIEFKFDLIIDRDTVASCNANKLPADDCGYSEEEPTLLASRGMAASGKLNDCVDELVESFVLHSNDVCLMSLGAQRGNSNAHPRDEFDYVSQLAVHALAYSYHLLQSRQPAPAQGDDAEFRHSYSIEISATLVLSKLNNEQEPSPLSCTDAGSVASASRQIAIVDVLAYGGDSFGGNPTGPDNETAMRDCDDGDELRRQVSGGGSTSVDCASIEDALAVIGKMDAKLGRMQEELQDATEIGQHQQLGKTNGKLLLIGLKLKQRINGGLFSNRLSLIDFDPKFLELHSIFESIFNGQALAHLKRQKNHLSSLAVTDESSSNKQLQPKPSLRLNSLAAPSAKLDDDNDGDEEAKKQHHQVASKKLALEKLIEAEWLLYKQLSSALIRTLIIVNVHKLSHESAVMNHQVTTGSNRCASSDKTGANLANLERLLMAENLSSLKFARLIQRASSSRLKRRKRHLKSHLASSTVSVANSQQSAATTTLTNRHEIDTHLSSPLRYARQSATTNPSYRGRAHELDGPVRSTAAFNSHRKASMDMSLALSRHHTRHYHNHRNRDHLHHHRTHHGGGDEYGHRRLSRHQMVADAAHGSRKQRSDFTESSSMSTSSGSQRTTCQLRSARSSRLANLGLYDRDNLSTLNYLSDSDSITSANLNSCSSYSYNDYNRHSPPNSMAKPHHSRARSSREAATVAVCRSQAKQSRMVMMRHHQLDSNSPTSSPLQEQHCSQSSPLKTQNRRSSSTSRASRGKVSTSVIEIDCQPNQASQGSSQELTKKLSPAPTPLQQGDGAATCSRQVTGDMTDNASEICSVVAEPPKQLKLEEFLNQLSSIIAPACKSAGHANYHVGDGSSLDGAGKDLHESKLAQVLKGGDCFRNPGIAGNVNDDANGNFASITSTPLSGYGEDFAVSRATGYDESAVKSNSTYEDDEDCKSHSSILEHLSSLALESNTRLNMRHQFHVQHPGTVLDNVSDFFEAPPPPPPLPLDCHQDFMLNLDTNSTLLNDYRGATTQPPTGHLQRLLNNSAQLRRNNNNPSRVAVVSKNSIEVEDRLRALTINCHDIAPDSPSSASSGAFVSSSNDSSCSSSASSATNDHKQTHQSQAMSQLIAPKSQVYASVVRRNQNVKT